MFVITVKSNMANWKQWINVTQDLGLSALYDLTNSKKEFNKHFNCIQNSDLLYTYISPNISMKFPLFCCYWKRDQNKSFKWHMGKVIHNKIPSIANKKKCFDSFFFFILLTILLVFFLYLFTFIRNSTYHWFFSSSFELLDAPKM